MSPASDGSWPLEPGARYSSLDRDIVRGDPSAPPTESEAAISIGISLKRIADALTGQTVNILTAPINSYGEGIGDAIQGQMIRGQRGIDQYEGRGG